MDMYIDHNAKSADLSDQMIRLRRSLDGSLTLGPTIRSTRISSVCETIFSPSVTVGVELEVRKELALRKGGTDRVTQIRSFSHRS